MDESAYQTLTAAYHAAEPYLGVAISAALFALVSVREGYKQGYLGKNKNPRVKESPLENLQGRSVSIQRN